MRVLAEEYGWVVGAMIVVFLLPPLLSFFGWMWAGWIGLWIHFFTGKSRRKKSKKKPRTREEHDDTTRER